ncbi:MAG: TSUP family transporter [Chlamydiia bacterium]
MARPGMNIQVIEVSRMYFLIGLLCLLVGGLGGVVSGLTGMGGGVVVLPALTALFHLEHQAVTAQDLVATSVSTLAILSLATKFGQQRHGKPLFQKKDQYLVLCCGAVGLIIPQIVNTFGHGDLQRWYLIVLLTGLFLQFCCQWGVTRERSPTLWVVIPCSCLCVVIGGSVGIGGAILLLPLLQLLGMKSQNAVDVAGVVTLTGLMAGSLSFSLFSSGGLAEAALIHGQVMSLLLIGGIPAALLCREAARSLSPLVHQRLLLGTLIGVTLLSVGLRKV